MLDSRRRVSDKPGAKMRPADDNAHTKMVEEENIIKTRVIPVRMTTLKKIIFKFLKKQVLVRMWRIWKPCLCLCTIWKNNKELPYCFLQQLYYFTLAAM